MTSQAERFEGSDTAAADLSPKIYRGANGVELPYWQEPGGKITRVAFRDDLIVDITYQKGGHIYANVPSFGRLEKKNTISFLSAAALIRRALEINNSVQTQLKEQQAILLAASEVAGETSPRPRSLNKLVSDLKTRAGPLRFFNPRPLIGSLLFVPVPVWLASVPGITLAEQLVYGAMIFRADHDGTFRKSLLGLGNFIRVSPRGIQKAAGSLEKRPLIFKATSHCRIPNEYKFVWLPEFDGSGEQCSPGLDKPDEQCPEMLTNRVLQPDEQSSFHKNKQLSQKKHEHDHVDAPAGELSPEEEDLMAQINELTKSENRTEHFRTVWERRVKEDSIAVFQAIGETRCIKREGKIKKTIGGALNWHYRNFHKARLVMRSKSVREQEGN